jgi:hypothetical protein
MAAFSPSRAPLCHHFQRHPRTQAVAQHPQAALSWQPPEHSSPATNANSTRVSDGGLLPHHKNYKRGGQGGLISPRNRLERALSPHQEPRPHRFFPEITSPRPMRMPPAANRSEPGLHAILSTHRLERLKTPAASSGAPLPALHPTAGAVPATAVDTPRSAHVNRTLRKQDHRIPAAPPVCDTPLAPTPQGAGLRRRSTDLHADPGMLSGWQACRLAEAATAAQRNLPRRRSCRSATHSGPSKHSSVPPWHASPRTHRPRTPQGLRSAGGPAARSVGQRGRNAHLTDRGHTFPTESGARLAMRPALRRT